MSSKYMLTFFLVIGLLFGLNQISFGQCEMKFDYSIENCSPGKKDGKIYITVSGGESQSYTFKIIDIYSGKYEFLKERKVNTVPGKKALVFDSLEESSYRIQIVSPKCKITIGGIEGIVVTQKEK